MVISLHFMANCYNLRNIPIAMIKLKSALQTTIKIRYFNRLIKNTPKLRRSKKFNFYFAALFLCKNRAGEKECASTYLGVTRHTEHEKFKNFKRLVDAPIGCINLTEKLIFT